MRMHLVGGFCLLSALCEYHTPCRYLSGVARPNVRIETWPFRNKTGSKRRTKQRNARDSMDLFEVQVEKWTMCRKKNRNQ